MNLILGTQLFDTPRLGLFLDSVRTLVRQHPMDCYSMHAMDHVPLAPLPKPFVRDGHATRLAKDIIPGSTSDKPCITDIFTRLAQLNADGWFMFVNSDVEISLGLLDILNQSVDHTKAFILYRRAYDPFTNNGVNRNGQDGFIVNSQWWLKHNAKHRDLPDIMGEPCWDNAFTIMMMELAGYDNVVHVGDMLYHREHPTQWGYDSHEFSTYISPRWKDNPLRYKWEVYRSQLMNWKDVYSSLPPFEIVGKQ